MAALAWNKALNACRPGAGGRSGSACVCWASARTNLDAQLLHCHQQATADFPIDAVKLASPLDACAPAHCCAPNGWPCFNQPRRSGKAYELGWRLDLQAALGGWLPELQAMFLC